MTTQLSWTIDEGGDAAIMDSEDRILFRSDIPRQEGMNLASRLVLCHSALEGIPDPAIVPQLVAALVDIAGDGPCEELEGETIDSWLARADELMLHDHIRLLRQTAREILARIGKATP